MKLACAVFIILYTAGAVHAGLEVKVGNHETARSGYAGTKTKNVGEASDVHALHEIEIMEEKDHPCYLRANKGDMNHKTGYTYEDWDRCDDKGPMYFSKKNLGWAKETDIKIRGLAVCTNKKNNQRMKGLKVYGTTVEKDGTLINVSKPDVAERPNCKIWHQPVYCPTQYIGTKVVIYHTGNETNGLGLICRKVIKK